MDELARAKNRLIEAYNYFRRARERNWPDTDYYRTQWVAAEKAYDTLLRK